LRFNLTFMFCYGYSMVSLLRVHYVSWSAWTEQPKTGQDGSRGESNRRIMNVKNMLVSSRQLQEEVNGGRHPEVGLEAWGYLTNSMLLIYRSLFKILYMSKSSPRNDLWWYWCGHAQRPWWLRMAIIIIFTIMSTQLHSKSIISNDKLHACMELSTLGLSFDVRSRWVIVKF